jgi:hypothetical protein
MSAAESKASMYWTGVFIEAHQKRLASRRRQLYWFILYPLLAVGYGVTIYKHEVYGIMFFSLVAVLGTFNHIRAWEEEKITQRKCLELASQAVKELKALFGQTP